MKISELPEDIRRIAEIRAKQNPIASICFKDRLAFSFNWAKTPEGHKIWCQADCGKYEAFREFHKNLIPQKTGELKLPLNIPIDGKL